MGNPLAGKGSIAEKIFLSMKMRDITTERRAIVISYDGILAGPSKRRSVFNNAYFHS